MKFVPNQIFQRNDLALMTNNKKLFYLFGLISNIWYTVLEGPISDKVLYGTWLSAFEPSSIIPSYLIGVAVTFWIPCEEWSHTLHKKMFPQTLHKKWHRWVFLFIYACLFEFIFGALVRFFFVFIMPSGDRSMLTAITQLFLSFFPCLIPNVLISHFLLKPSENLAKKLLRIE